MKRSIKDIISDPSTAEIRVIKTLICDNPTWHRTRLSKELCKLWNWTSPKGIIRDMACRNFLLKLHQAGKIELPPKRRTAPKRKSEVSWIDHDTLPISCKLKDLRPLRVEIVHSQSKNYRLFQCLLDRYHYLSFKGTVGKNIRYLIFDRLNRPVSCLCFESAAWSVKDRDAFVGWNDVKRKEKLEFVANNSRFLILPWVCIPNLASHLLRSVSRRLSADWLEKYCHPIYLLETFVEQQKFPGTCYQAAGWILAGQTTGRTRNDRYHSIDAAIKDVYVLPMKRQFQQLLS